MANVILKNVKKEYIVDNKTISVLKGINYLFRDKTITVILGQSGCGKTTLLRLLANLESCTNGNITIDNNYNNKIGLVFQENRLMPWLTVEENIMFSLKNKDTSKINKYLDLMGLTKFRKAYPDQISGGMAQRVSISRTLAYDPEVILMDEPFAALDYFTRHKLQQELIKIYGIYKKTIIFITHNVDEALILGHNILILKDGLIEKEYDVSDIGFPRDINHPSLIKIKKEIIDTNFT